MLRLNNLKPQPGATRKTKRLGRGKGSGQGTTGGKGIKGQTSRSGADIPIGFEGGQNPLYRRLPKRGFKNIHRLSNFVINLKDLERLNPSDFPEVSLKTLKEKKYFSGNYDKLTVLGTGEITKAFKIRATKVSPSALEKIKKAGGEILEAKPAGKSE